MIVALLTTDSIFPAHSQSLSGAVTNRGNVQAMSPVVESPHVAGNEFVCPSIMRVGVPTAIFSRLKEVHSREKWYTNAFTNVIWFGTLVLLRCVSLSCVFSDCCCDLHGVNVYSTLICPSLPTFFTSSLIRFYLPCSYYWWQWNREGDPRRVRPATIDSTDAEKDAKGEGNAASTGE